MRNPAVLFDFDGTLIDSMELIYEAFQASIGGATGRTPSRREIRAHFGLPEAEIIRRMVEPRPSALAIEHFHALYEGRHAVEVKIFPGVIPVLLQLASDRRKLGLVTGKGRRSTGFSLRALGLDGIFGAVITGDDVARPKPHPEGVCRALDSLRTMPEDALYVGDAAADLEMGSAAGVRVALAGWNPETGGVGDGSTLRFTYPEEVSAWIENVTSGHG